MTRFLSRFSQLALIAAAAIILTPASLEAQGGSWQSMSDLPWTTYGNQCRFLDGKLYSISGFRWGGATPHNAVWDPDTDTWTVIADFPYTGGYHLRQYAGITAWDGKLYLVGGDTGGAGWTDTLFCYDPVTGAWTTLAPMPGGPRYHLTADAINGKIYAVGGYDGAVTGRMEVYDIATNTWSNASPLPSARYHAMTAAIDGKLYVACGTDPSGFPVNALEIYDPSTGSWSAGPSTPIDFVTIGGSQGGDRLAGKLVGPQFVSGVNTLVSFDPATQQWTTLSPLPQPGIHFGFAADPELGFVHLVAGTEGGIWYSTNDSFNPGEVELRVSNFVAGQTAVVQTSGGLANAAVVVFYSLASFRTSPFGMITLDLVQPSFVGAAVADGGGLATIPVRLPGSASGVTVRMQAVQGKGGVYSLSNPWMGVIG